MSGHVICTVQATHAIERASDDLANLATLLRWAGRTAQQPLNSPGWSDMPALGCALLWAGTEIERHCAVISEAMSEAAPCGSDEEPQPMGELA